MILFIAIKKQDTPICNECGRIISSEEAFVYDFSNGRDFFICDDCAIQDKELMKKVVKDYKE